MHDTDIAFKVRSREDRYLSPAAVQANTKRGLAYYLISLSAKNSSPFKRYTCSMHCTLSRKKTKVFLVRRAVLVVFFNSFLRVRQFWETFVATAAVITPLPTLCVVMQSHCTSSPPSFHPSTPLFEWPQLI